MQRLALRPSQQDWPPHGLVSLWGMLELNAQAFYRAGVALRTVRMTMISEKDRPEEEFNALVSRATLDRIRPSIEELKVACGTMTVP